MVFDEGTVEAQPWRVFGDAHQMSTFETQIRKEIIELKLPMLATAPSLYRGHAAYECPIFCTVWMLKDLHRLNGIHWQVQPEVSARRISGVETVYQQCALLFACPFDTDFPCR